MKSIVLLICAAAYLQCYALGRPDLSHNGIMGVSQKKLRDYVMKAFQGYRKMMPQGDAQMGYPVLDPYQVEKASWDFADTTKSTKYRLNLMTTNTTVIRGLSNFELNRVEVDAKDMSLFFKITFNNLQVQFPYKLEGHLLKNFLPVWGEGIVKLSSPKQHLSCQVNLGIDQSYIVIEKASAYRWSYDIDIQATGLMDLPEPLANVVLDDIMEQVMNKHGGKALDDFANDLVEEAVGGMTTNEFFEYLDHFVKIADHQ